MGALNIKSEVTPQEMEGIKLSAKILKKKYPFITGIKLANDYRDWEGLLFVIVVINEHKLGEYFNCPAYELDKSSMMFDYYTLGYFLDDCDKTEVRKAHDDIDKKLKTIYEGFIPDGLSKYYTHEIYGDVYKEVLSLVGFICE